QVGALHGAIVLFSQGEKPCIRSPARKQSRNHSETLDSFPMFLELHETEKAELAGSGFGGVGGFAVFADHADEGLSGTREAAVAAVDQAEFAPEIHAFDGEELHFAGFHLILRKTLADKRDTGVGGDETLDHADTGQFHGDVNARAVRTEEFVEHLAGEAGAREDERLLGDLRERDLRTMSERVSRADHKAKALVDTVYHTQVGRLDGQRHDSHICRAILDAL